MDEAEEASTDPEHEQPDAKLRRTMFDGGAPAAPPMPSEANHASAATNLPRSGSGYDIAVAASTAPLSSDRQLEVEARQHIATQRNANHVQQF